MFDWDAYRPDNPQDILWDVIVVGTGMGGSFLGWSLARQGLKVLFLERGRPVDPAGSAPRTGRLQRLLRPDSVAADLVARGVWSRRVTVTRDGQTSSFFAGLGNGPGGSSVVYGAALERLRREDFRAADRMRLDPLPLSGEWPIAYDDFLPYYRKAEDVLGVRGTADPSDPDDRSDLPSPPPLSERDFHFFESFADAGLSPYRLHVGIAYKPGCTECQGVACPMDCKSEGASRALKPALADGKAKLLTGFTVERLGVAGDGIDHIVGRLGDSEIRIRGRVVVLAAGALCTPLILLNSTSERWPRGVGNDRDLVGRGLMFHVSEYFVIWPTRKCDAAGPGKTLSSRATNVVDGMKLGSLQSVGTRIHPSLIAHFLMAICERIVPFRIPFLRIAMMAAAVFSGLLFRRAALFATIIEDFAYHGNRVVPAPDTPSGFRILYNHNKDLAQRTSMLRTIVRRRLTKHRVIFLSSGDDLNYGHPSGTCRFGDTSSSSVLTPENRVHGVDNLYVVDASFFPSCGGTNPGLTIAANALRVAEVIGRQVQE